MATVKIKLRNMIDVEYGVDENTEQEEMPTSDSGQTSAGFEDGEHQMDVDVKQEDSL
ncbi:hypothetical protein [Clostridium formicaceticum]|uniref:Uncharacterized protein n=1 Tax=Clostridium formicaceticum TaxID=1497 RepID=A0AAC9RIJ0_9CLOT|nr:hypothetical protein [Clostridium formicaceticum]ARE86184.1 hypothetical protein CLFO_05060 [Clostridium formicaceticum]